MEPNRTSPGRQTSPRHGCVVWMTGLSGSGKTTLARAVERQLTEDGIRAFVLDGDHLRRGLNADLGFSPEDREENVRRVAAVAALFADAGVVSIVGLISPYRRDRERARAAIGPDRFLEVHLDAPLAVCEERDPKGLYQKAREGKIADFTGVSAPYEPPDGPDLTLRTGHSTIEECRSAIIELLKRRELISGAAQ